MPWGSINAMDMIGDGDSPINLRTLENYKTVFTHKKEVSIHKNIVKSKTKPQAFDAMYGINAMRSYKWNSYDWRLTNQMNRAEKNEIQDTHNAK